jgi:hypothetical protein
MRSEGEIRGLEFEIKHLKEDLECLSQIENTMLDNGDHRYMIYDAKDDEWCIIARGHAPAHLMAWCFLPAKYCNLKWETAYLAKRYVIEHARAVIKKVAEKSEWW